MYSNVSVHVCELSVHLKKSHILSTLSFAIVLHTIMKSFSRYCRLRSSKSSSSVSNLNTWASNHDPQSLILDYFWVALYLICECPLKCRLCGIPRLVTPRALHSSTLQVLKHLMLLWKQWMDSTCAIDQSQFLMPLRRNQRVKGMGLQQVQQYI